MAKQKASKKANKVKKEQSLKGDERVLLGCVGVDSGQLMVCDPTYIDHEWQHTHDEDFMSAISELSQYRDTETGEIFQHPMNWDAIYRNGKTYNEAYADGLFEEYIPDSVKEIAKHFSYAGCCANTLHGFGGQLHYPKGHAGAGVVFSSGLGDGIYEVWATIGEVEGWGRRVKKVEILLMDEE